MKHECEIVIVEDNPDDAELMIRNLKKNQLANKLVVLEDGEQALDYFFSKGVYKDRIEEEIYLEIRENSDSNNFFLFPANNACERHATTLNHIDFDSFCVDNAGKISLRFEKSLDEDFVRIKNG